MQLSFKLEEQGDEKKVVFSGPFDENLATALEPLKDLEGSVVVFNFNDVEFINSQGVKNWISFFKNFEKDREIRFQNCTIDVVMQINTLKRFLGSAEVESFYCDFSCSSCDAEKSELFEAKDGYEAIVDRVAEIKCENCNKGMDLEGTEEFYLKFLR